MTKKRNATETTQSREVTRRRSSLPASYPRVLEGIKARIRNVQVRAALAANREMIRLYWYIGTTIVEEQRKEAGGKSVVERLAEDIQRDFPGTSGFSARNIWRMRAFYLAWTAEVQDLQQPVGSSAFTKLSQAATVLPTDIVAQLVRELEGQNLPQVATQIPWFHNVVLVESLKDPIQRLWYARQTVEHGWSRAVLVHQIESGLYGRQGKAVTNFSRTLPAPQSDLAQQVTKDPYVFDFLSLSQEARERELENALLVHLKDFLLELGTGFAFVGNQYHIEVGKEDFYIDLLFYHLKLHCFVVIDLKMRPFIPEDAGKMNFYLNAVDDILRHADDNPSIGLILCKRKTGNRLILEYALRDMRKPIGVSGYKLTRSLPKELKPNLPTIAEIEKQLAQDIRKESHARKKTKK